MLIVEEARLTRDSLRYGFAVGKVKVLETRTLDASAYERLLDAPSFAEQKRLLSETPYGRYLEDAETPDDVEHALDEALENFYGFLKAAALPEPVMRFFRLRYDYSNFKAVAKAEAVGASRAGLFVDHGTIPRESFENDLSALPEPLGSLASTLALGPSEASGVSETLPQDPAAVDTLVDKAMFAELLRTAKASRSSFLVDLSRLAIDLANLKTMVRARRSGAGTETMLAWLIDGGTVPLSTFASLSELPPESVASALSRVPALRSLSGVQLTEVATLDEKLDQVTFAALRRGRMGEVGPEPVIAYVFGREAEVATLRVLLLGKMTGIDRETLRRHVGARG